MWNSATVFEVFYGCELQFTWTNLEKYAITAQLIIADEKLVNWLPDRLINYIICNRFHAIGQYLLHWPTVHPLVNGRTVDKFINHTA